MESGSYEFDSFGNSSNELSRLSSQASHFVDLEKGLLRSMGASSAQRILEIGCGPGFVTRLLAEIAPKSTIVAVDRSFELLQQLSSGLPDPKPQAVLPVQCSGERVPLEDAWAQFAYARFLFQHVPEPVGVATEALRTLTDGGILCVADSDDGLAIQYPSDQRITDLMAEAKRKQAEAGGDRNVGRKLPQILHDAGFIDIKARVINVTSSDVSIAVLLNMTLGYKALLAGSGAALAPMIAELSELAEKGCYFFSTGVIVVTGKSPPR